MRSQDDGATFGEAGPAWDSPTGACGCCQTRILATSSTSLALLYRSATNGTSRDIYVLSSHDNGRSFAGSRVQPWSINACPMTSMSLAAAGGRVMAAWETAGQVYWGVVDANGAVSAPAAAPGAGEGRKHPRAGRGFEERVDARLDGADRLGARRLDRLAGVRWHWPSVRADRIGPVASGLELRVGYRAP